jgi:predicted RNA-binding protein
MEQIATKNNFFIFVKNCGGTWNKSDRSLLEQQAAVAWDIGATTPNRALLQKGDKAIVYISGKDAKLLVGELTVESETEAIPEKMRKKYFSMPLVMSADYWVKVSKIKFWRKPLAMRDIVSGLSFIKNKRNFGAYLMGGVASIPERDYLNIVRLGNGVAKRKRIK